MSSSYSNDGVTVNRGQHDYYTRYTSQLWSAYQRWNVYDPSWAIINDGTAWEKINRDAVFFHAIQRRRKATAGVEYVLECKRQTPENQLAIEFMTSAFDEIERFAEARHCMTEAIFVGSSWMYISGDTRAIRPWDDAPAIRAWVPRRLQHVDRRRFLLRRTDDRSRVATEWTMHDVATNEWRPMTDMRPWIRTVFGGAESTLGYGQPLLDAIFFCLYAKNIAQKHGLGGLERWAKGLALVKIDGMRDGDTAGGTTNENVQDAYADIIAKSFTDHVITMDARDQVEMVQWDGTGWEIVKFYTEYFDSAAVQAILSSLLPTGMGSGAGSNARAVVEEDVSQQIFEADRTCLSEQIDRSIGKLIWTLNLPLIRDELRRRGLDPSAVERPRFAIADTKTFDATTEMSITRAMREAGMRVDMADAYARIGRPMPAADADASTVIEPIDLAAMQQQQPMFPGA